MEREEVETIETSGRKRNKDDSDSEQDQGLIKKPRESLIPKNSINQDSKVEAVQQPHLQQ